MGTCNNYSKFSSSFQDLSSLKNNFISNWLLKSDLKGLEGSEDIIKAICGDEVSQSGIFICYLNSDHTFTLVG